MVLVAIAAVLLGADAWWKSLRMSYQKLADEHSRAYSELSIQMTQSPLWRARERVADDWLRRRSPDGRKFSEESVIAVAQRQFDQLNARYGRRLQYHRAMERKYERAARYPWLPVPPDPPPPGSASRTGALENP